MSDKDSNTHELFDFMRAITNDMASEYERIQKRVKQDPGTAGDQGEENWATLLRDWLPPTYQIVTKGRILGHDGSASPQVDVLVLHPAYPRKLLDKKLYLAGGVAAAFECKVSLRSEHIKQAVSNSVKIKRLCSPRLGNAYKELHSPIFYGLLAHSHTWNQPDSRPEENITRLHKIADMELVHHPRETLDILCVSDLATWICNKIAWIGPAFGENWQVLVREPPPNGCSLTMFSAHSKSEGQNESFTPVGVMIQRLLRGLAWENAAIRGIADYFSQTGLSGLGQGVPRQWSELIFSEDIRADVATGRLIKREDWEETGNVFF